MLTELNKVLIKKGINQPTQLKIIELVTSGYSNSEISKQLNINKRDVKYNLELIYAQLKLDSRAQLIVFCLPHIGYCDAN